MSLAIIFPGQGSQSIGMLLDLYQEYPKFRETFTQASMALDFDIWQLIQNGPEEKLNETKYTQAAMLASDIATFRILEQYDLNIDFMAGHSLGEYAALVASKALDFDKALKLVFKRGELMQQTVPKDMGKMAAIVGLDDVTVKAICNDASDDELIVTAANFNAIGQVVIAGHTKAVEKAMVLAEENGAKLARIIPVSAPCHCELLKDAAEIFSGFLDEIEFKTPAYKVISNVDVSIYNNPQNIRKLLTQQLYSPVLWVQTIQFMQQQGVNEIIECGPAKVLSGLVKRIDKSIAVKSLNTINDLENFSRELI